ncbi:MAG: hypothetical protein ACYC2I_00265 [Elusimicrobiales bacterium]
MLDKLLEGLVREKLGGGQYGRKHGGHYYEHGDHRASGVGGDLRDLGALAEKIRLVPHLKTILICAAAGILLLLVLAALIIVPLALKLLGLLQQHGLKGIFEAILPFLNLLWQGSGRG